VSRPPRPDRLFVTTSYPRFEGDPAGCFVQARVRAFTDVGGQARVLAAGEPPGPDVLMSGPRVAVERIGYALPGAPALFYGGGAPELLDAGGPWPLLQAARLWAGLLAALRDGPAPGSIESHWLLPSALAVIAAGPAGVPHQAHAHSGDVALLERLPFGTGTSLARRLLAGASLVFVSADLRARFARLVGPCLAPAVAARPVEPAAGDPAPPDRSPRGVPAAERRALRVRLGLAGPVLIGVGRLVPIKGYDVLVRAVGRLPAPGRPTLVLLGEGPERGRLAGMAEQRRVALRLPGEVTRPEVWPWLTAADLFVHPSRRLPTGRTEGQPLAVREALRAGLTVIASALGGLEELASTEGTRLHVVPPDDPAALARLLERYILETGV
jgi:glycosyltransferase involved in cell wall biosynthesis